MTVDEQIIELIRQGKTSKEIGKDLFLSHRTVEKRLARMREKHNCKRTIQLLDIFKNVEVLRPINQES